jgi:hypothetical protein
VRIVGPLATIDHSSIVLLKTSGMLPLANDERVAMLKKS